MSQSTPDPQEFSAKVNEEFEKIRRNMQRPNILVCGGTGAGKSSLINMVLADQKLRAPVGAGKPITQDITKYEGELITVYDSPGYESGDASQKKYQEIVLKLIQNNNGNATDRIHLAWYCISQGNDRILDIDTKTVNDIKKQGIPIVIVLTQADKGTVQSAETLKQELAKLCPGIEVFETSEEKSLELGVGPLITWSRENLDDALRYAFISCTKSIEHKVSEGKKIVLHHIAAAATIAVSPIPFSDAVLLTGNQAALIARLAQLWNFPAAKSIITSALPGSLASMVGRSAAGNLAKLIPGWGSAAGAVINITVASSITAGIGYGLNSMFEKMAEDEFSGKNVDLPEYLKLLPDLVNGFTNRYTTS